MIWAQKQVPQGEVGSIERLFWDQAKVFDRDGQMLLVGVEETWPAIRLWVGLPEAELLAPYYGFTLCLRSGLPVAPFLLAGSAAAFERIFHGR